MATKALVAAARRREVLAPTMRQLRTLAGWAWLWAGMEQLVVLVVAEKKAAALELCEERCLASRTCS